jgi:hypothetical protein
MMFKQESCAQELFEGMQKAQDQAVTDEDSKTDRLVMEAMQELEIAALGFERNNRVSRAKEVTAVMMSLAQEEGEDIALVLEGLQENDVDDARAKPNKAEAIKVFRFLGFSPEDLKRLNFSSDEEE